MQDFHGIGDDERIDGAGVDDTYEEDEEDRDVRDARSLCGVVLGRADGQAGEGKGHGDESADEDSTAVDKVAREGAYHGSAKSAEIVGHVVEQKGILVRDANGAEVIGKVVTSEVVSVPLSLNKTLGQTNK